MIISLRVWYGLDAEYVTGSDVLQNNVILARFPHGAAERALLALNEDSVPPFASPDREVFLSHLRGLADRWIESGRDKSNGGENPNYRRVTNQTAGMLILPPREWMVRRSGDVYMDLLVPRNNATPVEEASRMFAALLDPSYRRRLSRCQNPKCRKYYFTAKQPKSGEAGLIRYGTYCSNCARQRQTSSAARSYENRAENTLKLKIAVPFMGKWPKAHEGDSPEQRRKQAKWVAARSNEQLRKEHKAGSMKPVTKHWISRHWAELCNRLPRAAK